MAKAEKSLLLTALDHCIIAASGTADFAPYCSFQPGGWLVGYDGMIAAGSRVMENLHVAPHTETFRNAVSRAGNPYSLTVSADGSMVVKGDKVRAPVPTFPPDALHNVLPDPPVAAFNDVVRQCIIDVGKIASVKGDLIVESSIMLRNNTAVATDGGTIVEAWHGAGLPGPMMLPVEFAAALAKVKSVPTACGFSSEHFTVWFGETQWLRTNLYTSTYPDTDLYFARLISQCTELRPVPPALQQAIETLKPFRETDMLTVGPAGINTRPDGAGATYGFEHHMLFAGEYPTAGLMMAAKHGDWIGFCREGAYWYGQVMRGITALKLSNA